jgi:hypothetical protein
MQLNHRLSLKSVERLALVVALIFGCSVIVIAQQKTKTKATSQSQPMHSKQNMGQETLNATLINPMVNAKEKTATVQVTVGGVKLIDPAMTNGKPTKGQGHLHYQIDGGPIIATTTTKLSFHNLTPGKHKIVIMLANNDHSPAGPQKTLEVNVP